MLLIFLIKGKVCSIINLDESIVIKSGICFCTISKYFITVTLLKSAYNFSNSL